MNLELSERTGLSPADIATIREASDSCQEIDQVVLFGSRAKGTHQAGSDVDLVLKGKNVSYDTAVRLSSILNEETVLPYFFDVLDYARIQDSALIDHINRVGVILYSRTEDA